MRRILASTEAAANSVSLKEALRMFKFQSPEELKAFFHQTAERSESRGVQWSVQGDQVLISKGEKKDNQIDTDAVIKKLLDYVHNIETNY